MTNTGLQSISDLTASTCITTGDIPPPLVGSSTTVIGTRLYLFAGRLVSTRRMTGDLYILDLNTFVWTRFVDEENKAPKYRYFHSANQYKNTIVFFGGMGYSNSTTSNEELCVLDDVSVFDLDTYKWHYPEIVPSSSSPRPRYAHLASITANKLVVVGGQDMKNYYIEQINVLDLDQWCWTFSRSFEKHCGAYRSVAVSSTSHTNLPLFANSVGQSLIHGASKEAPVSNNSIHNSRPSTPDVDSSPILRRSSSQSLHSSNIAAGNGSVGAFGSRGSLRRSPSLVKHQRSLRRLQSGNSLHRFSYTTYVTEDNPNPIYLYSNYNFTDVKRELQVIDPPTKPDYQIMDHSPNMTGAFLPPGLRFPTGAILGHHLIISGTYLTNTIQTFSIWALNLTNLVWTRIDTGSCFTQGSWNRGVLCEETNKYIVLGHRDRSLVEDYNHRQTNFDHMTVVDLEAFGVYQPPAATMSPVAQELGLALMNEPNMADFEIFTIDKQRIPVNSNVLSNRWPQFRVLVDKHADLAAEICYDDDTPRPADEETGILMYRNRALEFPETFNVTLAFLQYLYTDHLLTAHQHQPTILAQLLLLADMYNLDRLRQLARHGLHQLLSMATAALIYETAALSRQTGLQIRALKVMIAAKKMLQQQQQSPSSPSNDQQQRTHHHMSMSNASIITRSSLIDQDLISPMTQWSNSSSPPLSAALDQTRASYYDPYVTHMNSPYNGGGFRTRSSSAASALSMSNNLRNYLPTIQDSMSSSETIVEDGQSTTSTLNYSSLRSTRSTTSLKSIRSQLVTSPNGSVYATGGVEVQQQQQHHNPGFSYVNNRLTNLAFN
ncbi:1396_t:CDS:2 [Ambispora gerdemannii]|uniref:1396_t:CDS:1 n=1 Tax=Ambispora gerdemannii TaxID=144530 RepID=A0A9N9BJE3_9GLOM|nr:1396_t:CDS:2 [Ambispora gerdemannii]